MTETADPIYAAGVVCWRIVDGVAKVLLVHRTQHRDVSLPKGKLDPGELLPQTAVRELEEETGVAVRIGIPLDEIRYRVGARLKIVRYWAAEATGHDVEVAQFTPNREIAAVEWLTIPEARKKVSYVHDRELLDSLKTRLRDGLARTFPVIVVRHGKAIPRDAWDGPDSTRPLMHRGLEQAATIAPSITAFGPERIFSSDAERCLATVAPLSTTTGLEVKPVAALSEDGFVDVGGEAALERVVARRVAKKVPVVLCSHRPLLPGIVRELAALGGANPKHDLPRAANLSPGDFAVFHFALDSPKPWLVSVEIHTT